ncbi:hypothetical protein NMY3_00582 [Candidatus Nitrosocosmicus oleophilus]|jgi:hypothetical protein|uniref:Uncharacterized protein n=1 Tax=Candidatus Nitrosocosmicus oleophilus TaxID=1353260 RepID=A0A654M662_9ARCH|nr:hypothetical protein [Candidatus Nitrosocosmicus oleophilus]ALI34792.1 hypothetical protein NMY3_00582 [Candidatus Nitrosocosmicus oleophilus]
MILNLKVDLGNGYIHGIASNNQKSFKINIQEGSEIHMVIPEELQVNSKEGSIFFTTEAGYDISLQLSFKKLETDMILIYTDIDTLMKLAKDLPIQMEIK